MIKFSPIPNYNEHVQEMERFLANLFGKQFVAEEWTPLWLKVNSFAFRAVSLAKKWRGTKKAIGNLPKKMIISDLNSLAYDLDLGISRTIGAIDKGIEDSNEL